MLVVWLLFSLPSSVKGTVRSNALSVYMQTDDFPQSFKLCCQVCLFVPISNSKICQLFAIASVTSFGFSPLWKIIKESRLVCLTLGSIAKCDYRVF